jgi:hypothetical protein
VPCPLIGERGCANDVIEMFRNKLFDWTQTLGYFTSAWSHVKGYRPYSHNPKPTRLLHGKERETLRRIELSREMNMAYSNRVQQTIR